MVRFTHAVMLSPFVCLYLTVLLLDVNALEASVRVSAEGGVSLVGPHCPGMIRLTCEGVGLSILRWRYNSDVNIQTFDTLDSPTTTLLSGHSAFISSTLIEVTPLPDDTRLANFTSTLTVDLGQLQTVMDILCGDPGTSDSIPVNVALLQPAIPSTPNVTSIIASYQSTMLSSIEVLWGKMETVCSQFEASLIYQLSIGPSPPLNISQASCGQSLCTAKVNTTWRESINISLRAVNKIGESTSTTYPTIEHESGQYFSPELNASKNCDVTAQCVLMYGGSLSENSTCSVQYTSDPKDLLSDDSVENHEFNTVFRVQRLQPDTTYFFVFTVRVDERLTVNVFVQRSNVCGDPDQTELVIASTVVVSLLFIILCFILIGVIVYMLWKRKKLPKSKSVPQVNPSTDQMITSARTPETDTASQLACSNEHGPVDNERAIDHQSSRSLSLADNWWPLTYLKKIPTYMGPTTKKKVKKGVTAAKNLAQGAADNLGTVETYLTENL